MNHNEEHLARPRQPVLPSFSTRTLHHPSFLPLYMAAGFAHHHIDFSNPTVLPIIPNEFFYTDPTLTCGRRIPNIVSDLGVFDCFQLNTPPPVMSACVAPPNCPDPFRSGPHLTRNLGSTRWRLNPIHPPVQPSRAILQLTQDEDQAITNLLKLHHQEPRQSDEIQMDVSGVVEPQVASNPCLVFSHPKPLVPTEEALTPSCSDDVQHPMKTGLGNQSQQGRGWSDVELEAADTLLSGFSVSEEDRVWSQCRQNSTLPDPQPYQYNKDLPISTETCQESEALPALTATNAPQNGTGYIRFTCVTEGGGAGWANLRSAEDRGASGDCAQVREWTLSDLEGDAVHVLLSLGDMGTLDILQ
ncbi:uncharacterized protein LOC108880010 isoform X1 [Lates calcarifer]|uniref:Uncharacterized protein LOC108880010 isoform X1 n=1 Tax=Lates calcarifer TaxID=8187 RepID=A0AAJ7LM28_LATCA|nr:uncharacterized protein LOC108880010 isoform X1 [Lates calcarifer]